MKGAHHARSCSIRCRNSGWIGRQTAVAKNEVVVGLNHVASAYRASLRQRRSTRRQWDFARRSGTPTNRTANVDLSADEQEHVSGTAAVQRAAAGRINHTACTWRMLARPSRFPSAGRDGDRPTGPSGFSKAILANVTDLNGLRIELSELGPDSPSERQWPAGNREPDHDASHTSKKPGTMNPVEANDSRGHGLAGERSCWAGGQAGPEWKPRWRKRSSRTFKLLKGIPVDEFMGRWGSFPLPWA